MPPPQQQQGAPPPSVEVVPENFLNVLAGVNSAVSPDLIAVNKGAYLPDGVEYRDQLAWMLNGTVRGGKAATRPAYKFRMILPPGLVQGAHYFGVQGGMGVISCGGRLFRLRVNTGAYTWEEIALEWRNSSVLKQCWMCQTVESLVVQDFESDPIIYNGSTAVRSDPYGVTSGTAGVPRGKQMAYGNGRLWVAVDDIDVAAGDIRDTPGSELLFTETQYLAGGGNISIPNGITGLQFIATNGTTDYGPLLVFSAGAVESIRADITARDQWGGPGFVTNVLRNAGCAGQWALSQVNQDLYWRDMQGGIRSLYAAGSDENSAGSAPISREVSRLTDFDSWRLLPACSSIYFDNRLLVTSSPFLNAVGGVSWRDLISLDFAPYSVLQGKSTPAYDGQWSGLNITHMFTGAFMGRQRAFAIVHHDSGTNALWEIMPQMAQERDDELITCSSAGPAVQTSPIQSYLETSARPFGNPRIRKILDRFDVYLSEIDGPVELKVWWRKDNGAKWNLWDDTMAVNAQTTDPSTATPHVWQNLVRQARSQIKTYTIPSNKYGPDGYALQSGFEFQFRAAWTGRCKIYKIAAFAHAVPGGIYARRDLVSPAPLMEDATGNEITYSLDVNFGFDGRLVTVLTEPVSVTIGEGLNTSFATTASGTLPISYQWQVSTDSGATWNNVTDTGPYSGAATPTLVVTGAAFSLYGFKYRCEMKNNWSDYGCSGGTSAVYTTEATLTVVPYVHGWGAGIASGPVDAIGSDPANPSHIVQASHGSPSQLGYSMDNGATWHPVTVAGGWAFQQAASVCCGNGYFVVTGPDDGHLFRVAYCPVTDLTAWYTTTLGSVYTYGGLCASCFADDIGQFCALAAMGTGKLSSFTCTNPSSWVEHTTTLASSAQAGGICRGNGLFVAVTYSDTWISADNGLTWTKYSGSFTSGTGVVYASTQEKFVMCGTDRSHSIWTAADGFTWAEQGVAGFEGFGICYTHGLVVSVGNSSPGWGYTSVSSSDLAAWAVNPLPSALTFASSVCPCAGGVIAGSDNGNNYVSVSLI